jgi:hypothetical protein
MRNRVGGRFVMSVVVLFDGGWCGDAACERGTRKGPREDQKKRTGPSQLHPCKVTGARVSSNDPNIENAISS